MNAMKRPIITMPAILIFLMVLVFAPSILMGYQNERNAREALAAGNQLEAARQFELAARRLLWQPELWNEAGRYYSEAGQVLEMIKAYWKAKERNALDACGWIVLGNFSEHPVEVWQEGLLYYSDAPLLYVGIADYYYRFGDINLEREYVLDAAKYKEHLTDCSSKMSWDFSITHYRAGLFLMQDDPTHALEELNTASRLNSKFAPVVETLRTTLNLASLEDDPVEKLILIGRGLGLAEEWQLAASAFDNATQADPESASAWAWLGQAEYQLGEDGLASFEKAESINPNDSVLLSLRGLYWQQKNDFESARQDFEILAQLEPQNPNWQASLGAIYAELGDLPTALAAYEKAVDLDPAAPIYRQLLALFSFNYRYDMAGMGLSAARRAVILAPEAAEYIDTLGLLYLGLERNEDAERQFLRALEKDAEYAAAHFHLGILYLQRGERELAYSSLLQAQELASNGVVRADAARLLAEYFQ